MDDLTERNDTYQAQVKAAERPDDCGNCRYLINSIKDPPCCYCKRIWRDYYEEW